jgi:Zn-dependent M28 family amino/carboxypeptidase
MRLATLHVPQDARGALRQPKIPPGTFWVRFGDEVLLYAEDTKWNSVVERAHQQNLRLQEHSDAVEKDSIHLVIQNGRRFQQEHPEVQVLFDKGRYIAVALDPEEATQMDGGVCFGIKPLEENTVVFDVRARAAERAAPDARIQNLVDAVSRSDFEASLTHLASFPTRFSTSAHYEDAATWARGQLEAMGYATTVQPISIPILGDNSQNVVAERLGTGSGTRELVLVVAHLDSINIRGGPEANAPGADDNATGSAGLLEIARVLKDHAAVHDLRFVLFGGEEEGLFGSQQYIDDLPAADRARIRAIINMDMIGTLNAPNPNVLLEGAAVSQSLIDELASAAATYTALGVQRSLHPFNSDHVPFIEEGFSAVLTIEGTDGANDNVHTANDTLDNIDYDLALDILRMNVATTAKALAPQEA